MRQQILFVNQSKKIEINALRKQEYANASGFNVDLSKLQWNISDEESYVMAAEKENQLISTMRGEVLADLSLLEKKLECPWHFPVTITMPVLLLSRAATATSERANGFNLILRYWFLQFAIHHQLEFIIGTFISGSPRQNSLQKMGYQFFTNHLGWQQSSYRSLKPVTVAVLNLKTHKEQALNYCLARNQNGIHTYQFNGQFPALRFVRNL